MADDKDVLILIADDEESIRASFYATFSRDFPYCEVDASLDGWVSLKKRLEQIVGRKGVGVIDNSMPLKDQGLSIIKEYAQKPGYEDFRFILCASASPEIGKEAVQHGAFAYLPKPVMPDNISETIRKALDSIGD